MIAPSQINNSNLLTEQPVSIDTLAQAPTPKEDIDRKHRQKEAWRAYRGELPPPLKISPNQPDDNVLSNRCGPIVKKSTSFLFGNVLKIEATDEKTDSDADDDSPIQDFIDGLWGDDDDRMTTLSQMAINGGVCGSAFLKLIPPQGQMKYPRIVVMDPMLIRIVTAPDDISLIQAYIIEYHHGSSDLQKRQIIMRVDPDGLAGVAGEYDLDDTWQIANYIRRAQGGTGQDGTWVQVGETVKWDYPFPPIFHCQNQPNPSETWGEPDLTPDLIGLNKVLNFVQSNTSRIVKYHGHPITYATGLSATQIQMGVDDLICLPSPESKLEKLEAMTDFPGLLNFAAQIRADMDEQSRVPAVALGRTAELPKGNISGVALQLLFQPLIEMTTMKRRLAGRCIRDITRAALVIAELIDLADYEDYKIDLHWPPILPSDDLQAAQEAVLLQQLGVSQATVFAGLGLDAQDEAIKKADEDAQQMTNYAHGVGLPPAPPVPPTPQPMAQTPNVQAALPGGTQATSGGNQ